MTFLYLKWGDLDKTSWMIPKWFASSRNGSCWESITNFKWKIEVQERLLVYHFLGELDLPWTALSDDIKQKIISHASVMHTWQRSQDICRIWVDSEMNYSAMMQIAYSAFRCTQDVTVRYEIMSKGVSRVQLSVCLPVYLSVHLSVPFVWLNDPRYFFDPLCPSIWLCVSFLLSVPTSLRPSLRQYHLAKMSMWSL